MMTGANDGRVAPYHSRKMTARLLVANKSGTPILLRTSSSAGHGIGTALSERIKQSADIYAFLFAQLGMPGKAGISYNGYKSYKRSCNCCNDVTRHPCEGNC
jgi:hypothetical protein